MFEIEDLVNPASDGVFGLAMSRPDYGFCAVDANDDDNLMQQSLSSTTCCMMSN